MKDRFEIKNFDFDTENQSNNKNEEQKTNTGFFSYLKTMPSKVFNRATKLFDESKNKVQYKIEEQMNEFASSVEGNIATIVENTEDVIESVADRAKTDATDYQKDLSKKVREFGEDISDKISDGFKKAKQANGNFFKRAFSFFSKIFDKLLNGIMTFFENMFDKFEDVASDGVAKFTNIITSPFKLFNFAKQAMDTVTNGLNSAKDTMKDLKETFRAPENNRTDLNPPMNKNRKDESVNNSFAGKILLEKEQSLNSKRKID